MHSAEWRLLSEPKLYCGPFVPPGADGALRSFSHPPHWLSYSRLSTLLWLSTQQWLGTVGVEYAVDPPGGIAFDAPADFFPGSPFCLPFGCVSDGLWIEGHPGEGNQVKGFIRGPVAAA